MTNIDKVRIAMKKKQLGAVFNRNDIFEMVKNEFPNDNVKKGSINPADYCYNLINLDKLNNKSLLDFNIFESQNNMYKYLGENYPYDKEILHKPKSGEPYVIGRWINGERILGATKTITKVDNRLYKDLTSSNPLPHKTMREVGLKMRFLVMKRDNFKCCICGASPAKNGEVELEVDHIIPWSKGGETIIDNLQTLCSKCNRGKGNLLE